MSIKGKDFKWEKGKNDLEYIVLLRGNLYAMTYKLKECAKVAKEQYNKGRESAFKEIAYSEELGLTKESEYEKRIRADERTKVLDEVKNSIHEIYSQNLHCKADMCERDTMGYDCEDCLATFLMGYIEDVMKSHK